MVRPLCVVLLAAGCATVPPAQKLPAAEAFASRKVVLSPEEFVLSQPDARSCVRAARLEPEAQAWTFLGACTRHRRFSDLNLLLTDWPRELRTKADANQTLARVLSERGSLKSDLALLQGHGIGVYDLSTALMRPQAFRGRLVAFMGEVRESTTPRTVNLVEVTYGSEPIEVRSAPRVTFETKTSEGYEEKTTRDETELRFVPAANETGRGVIARLSGPSLSLTAERPHLFLARFEGTQQLDDKVDDTAAVVQVVAYSAPSAW